MTGRANLHSFYKKTILITVYVEAAQFLEVTRRLPLDPKLLSRATPEGNFSSLDSAYYGLSVHVPDHKNITIFGILYHSRNQSVLVKS
jgi:hypothetical protein